MTFNLPPSSERGGTAWRSVQRLINLLGVKSITVDGVPGPQTYDAYMSLPDSLRPLVEGAMRVRRIAGFPARLVRRVRDSSSTTSTLSFFENDIKAKIAREAASQQVNPELALRIASLESNFNPNAVAPNGIFKGLFQLGPPAIADVQRLSSNLRIRYSPPPSGNVFDVDWNIRVGIAYIRVCAIYLRNRGIAIDTMSSSPSDWAKLYGAFNVGHVTAGRLVKGLPLTASQLNLVNNQARKLREGGPAKYLANAQEVLLSRAV